MRKNPPGSADIPPESMYDLSDSQKAFLDSVKAEIPVVLENYSDTYGISDWKKCKPLEWRGFCRYTAKTLFYDKTLLKEPLQDNGSCAITNSGAFSIPLLSALWDIYADLCLSVPALPCRVSDFESFVGLSDPYFRALLRRVSPLGVRLFEKSYYEQEQSMAMAAEGGRINVTMALAWNNHFHGWTQAKEIIHRDGGAALDSGSWKSRFLGDSGQEKPGISAQVAPLLPENTEE